jgi:hypothetical protein
MRVTSGSAISTHDSSRGQSHAARRDRTLDGARHGFEAEPALAHERADHLELPAFENVRYFRIDDRRRTNSTSSCLQLLTYAIDSPTEMCAVPSGNATITRRRHPLVARIVLREREHAIALIIEQSRKRRPRSRVSRTRLRAFDADDLEVEQAPSRGAEETLQPFVLLGTAEHGERSATDRTDLVRARRTQAGSSAEGFAQLVGRVLASEIVGGSLVTRQALLSRPLPKTRLRSRSRRVRVGAECGVRRVLGVGLDRSASAGRVNAYGSPTS